MSLDPERVYAELGKALAEEVHLTEVGATMADQHREESRTVNARQTAEKDDNRRKLVAAQARKLDLLETVRLMNEEGMDPTLAKLKARESREDRDKAKFEQNEQSESLAAQIASVQIASMQSALNAMVLSQVFTKRRGR